jgi:S-adenosylmethionine-diacylgycerolhomoserine-N-methlytransferase
MSHAAALMDKMYRRQRHFYDASRKYYLVGRDETIARLKPRPSDKVLEIGCGTARNLIEAAKVYPQTQLFGLDVSRAMLDTAAASITRAGLSSRIALAQADATAFDPQALFGHAQYERVLISYALSMIPPWRTALARALDLLAPGGSLHLVDFGDFAGLPVPFRVALRGWLAAFDVTPRDALRDTLAALSVERGLSCQSQDRFRGYATLAIARRGENGTGLVEIRFPDHETDPVAP